MRLDKSEWNRTFPRYMQATKRDLVDVLNTKALFIARRAVVETPKANYGKMAKSLDMRLRMAKAGTVKRGGKTWNFKQRWKASGTADVELPQIVAIIQSRAGRGGKSSPYKGVPRAQGRNAMKKAVSRMFGARARSIGFLKSGWIPAIRKLEPLAINRQGLAKRDSSAKQFGRPKGSALPARHGFWRARAVIENAASAKRDHKEALIKYGLPALQRSFDYEARSMAEYLEKKLKDSARRLGVKVG